jgi:hypothetical protein
VALSLMTFVLVWRGKDTETEKKGMWSWKEHWRSVATIQGMPWEAQGSKRKEGFSLESLYRSVVCHLEFGLQSFRTMGE